MRSLKYYISRIYDLPNAYRVLDIMDKAGADAVLAMTSGDGEEWWKIKTNWYVNDNDAADLIDIVLYKEQYRRRSKVWGVAPLVRKYRDNSRILSSWFN